LPALHVRPPAARGRVTLIFSHGNAVDIGQMHEFFVVLAQNARVNLLAYDYSGYGHCRGSSLLQLYLSIDSLSNPGCSSCSKSP